MIGGSDTVREREVAVSVIGRPAHSLSLSCAVPVEAEQSSSVYPMLH